MATSWHGSIDEVDAELPVLLEPFNWATYLVVVGTVEPRVRPALPRALATGRLTPLGRALLPCAEARLTSRVRDARRRRATAATTGGA